MCSRPVPVGEGFWAVVAGYDSLHRAILAFVVMSVFRSGCGGLENAIKPA